MEMYKSLEQNDTDFEIIAVGNKKPDFELPPNMRHIYTPVKPIQCSEIGFRATRGELIMLTSDDVIFGPHALDNLYKQYDGIYSFRNKKVIISSRRLSNGVDDSDMMLRFNIKDSHSPLFPMNSISSRDLWMELGGMDRRFIALWGDLDMAMRIYEVGGIGILSNDAMITELPDQSILYNAWAIHNDIPMFASFWVKDNVIGENRLCPVEPFEDKDILTISQGNKGTWD